VYFRQEREHAEYRQQEQEQEKAFLRQEREEEKSIVGYLKIERKPSSVVYRTTSKRSKYGWGTTPDVVKGLGNTHLQVLVKD